MTSTSCSWDGNRPPVPAALASIGASPSAVVGGNPATGTVTLTSAAPTGGALVSLASASSAVTVPGSVTVGAGGNSATFGITTSAVAVQTLTTLSASYGGITKTTTFTTNPAPAAALAALTLNPTSVKGGTPVTGTVTLTAAAPSGGVNVALASSSPTLASVPGHLLVPAGKVSAAFTVATTKPPRGTTVVTIAASYAAVTKKATVKLTRK